MEMAGVSKLCLGTMTFGEQNSYKEAATLLSFASESGINFFDTAEMYPVPQRAQTHGRSESYLGRWLKESGIVRDKVFIATKVAGPSGEMTWIRGGPSALDKTNIRDAIDESLRRLSLSYIDLYQIHWPDRYVPMFGEVEYDPSRSYTSVSFQEQLEALSEAVALGKIRYVGLSNETPYGVCQFCRLAKDHSHLPRAVSIQVRCHTVEERLLSDNSSRTHTTLCVGASTLPCRSVVMKKGTLFIAQLFERNSSCRISLLAYSPLAMGLLTGKYLDESRGPSDARLNLYRGRYSEAECRYSFAKPNLVPAIKEYVEISKRHGISPVALAIGFVLRHPLVKSAVVGATKVSQLQEIVEASTVKLTKEVLEEIDVVHNKFPNPAP